eukprot:3229731-Pyramimonas_sp.AAC.1
MLGPCVHIASFTWVGYVAGYCSTPVARRIGQKISHNMRCLWEGPDTSGYLRAVPTKVKSSPSLYRRDTQTQPNQYYGDDALTKFEDV